MTFGATHFTELIDWDKENITEPPLTSGGEARDGYVKATLLSRNVQ
jgi:hypothetical protein